MKHPDYHIRTKTNNERAMTISVVILLLFVAIELAGAYYSNSLALFGDAMHLLTDAFALGIALFGFWLSRKPPTETYSYGYMRSEVIAAFFNALLWFIIFAYIIYEAVYRFIHVEIVDVTIMMPIAIAGLIVNLVIFKILHNNSDDNINMRGAILHVLMDILGSIGAIIGGIIGNKVGDGNDIGKVLGVVIGSNIGSKEQGEVRNVCSNVTRYNEVQKTSYSHSVLTFEYNGTIQSINFTK